jgi:hypothetical protein
MSDVEPGSPARSLIGRVLNLLLHPAETWDVIEAEPATIEGLYRGWVLPLAAIPAVCRALGLFGFRGIEIFGVRYEPSFVEPDVQPELLRADPGGGHHHGRGDRLRHQLRHQLWRSNPHLLSRPQEGRAGVHLPFCPALAPASLRPRTPARHAG